MLKKYRLPKKILWLFIILCLTFVVSYIVLFYFIDDIYICSQLYFIYKDVLFSLSQFIINFCLLYCLYGIGKYYLEFEEVESLQQCNHVSQDYLDKSEDEERKYYEEILEQQSKILYAIEHGKNPFQEFLDLDNTINHKNIFFCDNPIIDASISTKVAIMIEKDIDFSHHISIPSQLDIKDIDISTILFNLLDNAIHACDSIELLDKSIFLEVKYQFHILKICVKNTYYPYTKQQFHHHGYGLKIIQDIVCFYHGDMNIIKTNEIYEIDICLYGGLH